MSDDELSALETATYKEKKALESVELKVRSERIRRQLLVFDRMLETLDDEEAPGFGRRFVERVNAAKMAFDVAYDGLSSVAVYTAYSLAEKDRGFRNMMGFHPDAMANVFDLFLYSTHERGHGIQNQDVEALKCSPFNSSSRAVVHPLHWIELELHCERDTIAHTAFIASKMADLMPGLAEHTVKANSILNVDEFERIRSEQPSLMDSMVAASLASLTKYKNAKQRLKFEDSYCETALEHISAGLFWRREFELGDVTFVRLTEEDFQQVGNHGILPNTMGEHFMEPLLLRQTQMNQANREFYEEICKKYGIPDLQNCQTLQQYNAGTVPSAPMNSGVWASSSGAVHSPPMV